MNNVEELQEKLAAILAADAVGYSLLMHDDEKTTVATLHEFRGVFRQRVDVHHGRIVDMAGDSILAVFDSATGAVNAATEAQLELAKRNETLPQHRQMWFRVGVHLGDLLMKEDGSVYGDGVNVAARLQSMASPGGINVSGSVFNSVRAKVDGPFIFLGDHELKNIAAPVPVYSVGVTAGGAGKSETVPSKQPGGTTRPMVIVMPLKIISGGDGIVSLAEGLYQDIVGSLTKQTAIDVISGSARSGDSAGTDGTGYFQLDGSVRSVGERLRLSFTLLDTAARCQIWSERYDRQLEDIFELEDEISRNVASTVRLRIKARTFEKLRNTNNDELSVPDLLSKAAGYLVSSVGHNDEVAEILRVALDRMPDNSMANAMTVFCRYRTFEFSVFAIPDNVKEELFSQSHRAVSLDASSYFAHLIAAMIHQDIRGDFEAALVHAETALALNPGFSQATAMAGVARIHLGEPEIGIRMLQSGIDSAPEDPHRFRHLRELAIGYLMSGETRRAASVVDKLMHQAPDLLRNEFVSAPILWHAGRPDEAKRRVDLVLARHPELNQRNMRPVKIRDPALAGHLANGLTLAGLPA